MIQICAPLKKNLLLTLLLSLPFYSFGQIRQIVPPAPTSAGLGQYADIPVSNYTGVPSISIPLYTLRSGAIELPITLSYHASGIKVAQEASWVGLGWSLNAGGVITRQINGTDDFASWGYVRADSLPPIEQLNDILLSFNIGNPWGSDPPVFSFEPQFTDAYDQCERAEHGTLDTQPDIFFYNFLGYSGRAVFPKQSAASKVQGHSIEQNNLRFIYDLATGRWEVTDGNGWQFFFFTSEVTRSVASEQPWTTPNASPNGAQSPDMISAWYLDKVVTPAGDSMTFEYDRTGRWLQSPVFISERSTRKEDLKLHGGEPGFCFSDNNPSSVYSAFQTMADEVYLKRINFSNGHILFHKSAVDRLDRTKFDITLISSPYLSAFTVYDELGTELRTVKFSYSYFREDMISAPDKEDYLRLRLDEVEEMFRKPNGQYVYLPPYRFEYNETPLPRKNSWSTDHWGYFNGADNTSIKGYKFIDAPYSLVHQEIVEPKGYFSPRINIIDDLANVSLFINGANREPNVGYAKAGTLTGIRYPTGGVSKFNFDLNDFWNYADPQFDENIVTLLTTSHGTKEQIFTLTKSAFVFLRFRLVNHNYLGDPLNTTVMNNMTAVLENLDGTDILKFIPSDSQMDDEPGGNNNVDQMVANVSVLLDAGTYRIKTDHGGYVYLDMSLEAKFAEQIPTYKKTGAGLRIRSIETYENEGGPLLKRRVYSYEESGKSTGRMLGKVQNFYNETEMMHRLQPNPGDHAYDYYSPCCYINSIASPVLHPLHHKIVSSAESIVPLGTSAQGTPIGYDNVTVADVDGDGNVLGKSIFHYKNYEEGTPAIFLPNVPRRIFIENGQLIKEQHFNGDSQLVKESRITYALDSATRISLPAIMVHRSYNDWIITTLVDTWTDFPAEELPVYAGVYDVYSEWWYPTSASETTYDVSGSNSTSVTITYEYGNPAHKQITKTVETNGRGLQKITSVQYASDNPTGTGTSPATLAKMIEANMHNAVIKEEVRLNGALVQGSVNDYTVDQNDHIVMAGNQILNTDGNHYETTSEFQKYDASGRILQMKSADGIVTSFIWSYNGELPVVRGQNVDHNTLRAAVEAAAGTSDLEAFWSSLGEVTDINTIWNTFNLNLRNNPSLNEAMVDTYTYRPLVGMTSETDRNGKTVYYEYDDRLRLKFVRNADGEILKGYEYVYGDN